MPTQSKHPEEAKALAAWLTAPEQQIKAFTSKGTFPSPVDALEDPALTGTTNEFFNDAPTGEILANRAEAVEFLPTRAPGTPTSTLRSSRRSSASTRVRRARTRRGRASSPTSTGSPSGFLVRIPRPGAVGATMDASPPSGDAAVLSDESLSGVR